MTREEVIQRQKQRPSARMARLAIIRKTVVPLYLREVPSMRTLQQWFKRAGIESVRIYRELSIKQAVFGVWTRTGNEIHFNVAQVEAYLIRRFGAPKGVAE